MFSILKGLDLELKPSKEAGIFMHKLHASLAEYSQGMA